MRRCRSHIGAAGAIADYRVAAIERLRIGRLTCVTASSMAMPVSTVAEISREHGGAARARRRARRYRQGARRRSRPRPTLAAPCAIAGMVRTRRRCSPARPRSRAAATERRQRSCRHGRRQRRIGPIECSSRRQSLLESRKAARSCLGRLGLGYNASGAIIQHNWPPRIGEKMPPQRSARAAPFSIMPGANSRALEKARSLDADGLIFDPRGCRCSRCQDGGASRRRRFARGGRLWPSRAPVCASMGLRTPWGRDDLAAASRLAIDGVLLPKVESAEAVRRVEAPLAARAPPTKSRSGA